MTADTNAPPVMHPDEALARLAALPLFEPVPREELVWLLERGELRYHVTGETLRRTGSTVDEMSILLGGRIGMYVRRGQDWRRVMEVETGFVMGVVPFSRMQEAPANVVVEADTTLLAFPKKRFPDLIQDCPGITTALVHRMVDRSREFRTLEMHDERLVALGKLASGLSHELNNPASAATSAARSLVSLLAEAEQASRGLAEAGLSLVQLTAVDTFRTACARPGPQRTALETADREDAFTEWLERHGADPGGAVALAASDVDPAALETLDEALPADALRLVVGWVACNGAAREVARQIQAATERIHGLVHAVKGFTFMDRAGVPEEIDVTAGLGHTIAMLDSKARAKSVDLHFEAAPDVPPVYGYGSEINQVWQTLIDNAIDAAGPQGKVTITATARAGSIIVRVADDGPGIPEENRSRVFDPFFTTKPVGSGTGLGLYQARRTVHTHHGDISVVSAPGRTVFRVHLPQTGGKTVPTEPRDES